MSTTSKVLVWDVPTRVFHWLLAGSFFAAYALSESERLRHLHVMFGYTVLGLVVFRLVWGFVGTRYARFSSFLFGPKSVLRHVGGMARLRSEPHVGHTPAGSWAIYAMLILALVTAVSGYLNFNDIGGDAMEEIHEVAANAWMLLVCVHIAGVIVSSLVERQNLPRSMVTGYKKLAAGSAGVTNKHVAVGLLMAASVVGFWAYAAGQPGTILGGDVEQSASRGDYGVTHEEESDDD